MPAVRVRITVSNLHHQSAKTLLLRRLDQQRRRKVTGNDVRVHRVAKIREAVFQIELPERFPEVRWSEFGNIVHHNVQLALFRANPVDQLFHLLRIGMIEHRGNALSAPRGHHFRGLLDRLRPPRMVPWRHLPRPVPRLAIRPPATTRAIPGPARLPPRPRRRGTRLRPRHAHPAFRHQARPSARPLPHRPRRRPAAVRRRPRQIRIATQSPRRALRRMHLLRPHSRSYGQRPRLSPNRSHRPRLPRHHPRAVPRPPPGNAKASRPPPCPPRTPPPRPPPTRPPHSARQRRPHSLLGRLSTMLPPSLRPPRPPSPPRAPPDRAAPR